MTDHTPAPWVCNQGCEIVNEELGEVIAEGFLQGSGIAIEDNYLALILAAPDMYAKLDQLQNAFLKVPGFEGEAIDIAEILKKARGEV